MGGQMASFDFITEQDFRDSLETDYEQMCKSIEIGAWKSAQVLAGSVVEALLVDYLLAVPNTARVAKDPLSMDLAEAIAVCRTEKALSGRTADLCSVVRSYRNLIHPGRVVRLKEPAPNRDSASIAMSLVQLISDELAVTRRAQIGLTAGQLVSKLERDQGAVNIFKHLIGEANEQQRRKLLIDLLPKAHVRHQDNDEDWTILHRIEAAFDITFAAVSDDVKRAVAADFVRILREEDGAYVTRHAEAFFRAPMLKYVPETQQGMVRGYMLSRLDEGVTSVTLRMVKGICPLLRPEEAPKFVDPLVKAATSKATSAELRREAFDAIAWSNIDTLGEWDAALLKRLNSWKGHFRASPEKVKITEELIELVELPF
jgi:hypothetical protein